MFALQGIADGKPPRHYWFDCRWYHGERMTDRTQQSIERSNGGIMSATLDICNGRLSQTSPSG
jgi:hypothetical protein